MVCECARTTAFMKATLQVPTLRTVLHECIQNFPEQQAQQASCTGRKSTSILKPKRDRAGVHGTGGRTTKYNAQLEMLRDKNVFRGASWLRTKTPKNVLMSSGIYEKLLNNSQSGYHIPGA